LCAISRRRTIGRNQELLDVIARRRGRAGSGQRHISLRALLRVGPVRIGSDIDADVEQAAGQLQLAGPENARSRTPRIAITP
jgi:hypothetical protein